VVLGALVWAGSAALAVPAADAVQAPAGRGQQTRGPAGPDPRALAPWPDDATLEEKRREAENRRLFRSVEPLEFTLIADFGAVNRDRNPNSTRTFPATLVFAGPDGAPASMPLQIRTRGHSRRKPQVCSFAPLRLEFQKDLMKGTVFAGHKSLKLGTHCRDSGLYEQYVLREYTAYKVYNLLTPLSFRARLARATYVDQKSKRTVASRYAIFIEDDDDVAERMKGRIMTMLGIPFRSVDLETVTRLMLFEYMIGNTDMSVAAQHNVRLVQTQDGRRYPVPYDFDYSGLVDTTYSMPDKQLGIATVRDRLYRGPCRTPAEFEPFFAQFRTAKDHIMALYDALPDMTDAYRRNAKDYLEEFYRTIDRPRDVKKAFVDGCNGRAGSD
jgi:hypothetical protein